MALPPQTSPDTVTPCETDDYYFAAQLKRYITQFSAIFAGLKVRVGASAGQESRLIRVPVVYGSQDRVVAWIKGEQTQNKPLRLPTMSTFLRGIRLAPELRKGVGATRRFTVARNDGNAFPENVGVVYQQMPIPYVGTFELNVFASNTLQHQQIMEQLLVLFDPQLQIQTSDDPVDWTQITTVTLQNVQWDVNFPAGADRRILQSTLQFEVVFYLAGPAEFKKQFIENIKIRLAVVPTDTNFNSTQDVLDQLDDQNTVYIDLFSLNNIDIEKS